MKTSTKTAVETWFQRSCLTLSALSRYKRANVSTSQARRPLDRQFISFTGTKNKVKHIRHTSNGSWAMAALTNIPRGILSGLLWAIGICGMGGAMAGPSDCYGIKDADRRHYCLAMYKGDTGNCYSIKDQDDRNLCLAQVKGQRSHCHSIRESDQRKQCLALVK